MRFVSFPSRFVSWAKKPLPATQTAALLLILSAGATAAWLPSQTRLHLAQPLAYLAQSRIHLADVTTSHVSVSHNNAARKNTAKAPATLPLVLASTSSGGALTKGRGTRAVTLTVTSTSDAADANPGNGVCQTSSANGATCTLRAAIQEANAQLGNDIINFNIPGSGIKIIALDSALPEITDPVAINGYSQPGSSANTNATGAINAVPLVQIMGNGGTGNDLQLSVGSGGSQVRGLILSGAGDSGIELDSPDNVVAGCFIGTNAVGTAAQGNNFSGVRITGFRNGPDDPTPGRNTIGGVNPADRNLISGNGATPAVQVQTSDANNATIRGNLIGLNKAGTAVLANGSDGVQLSSFNGLVSDNVISGNTRGVVVVPDGNGADANNNTIQNNFIGTSAAGTATLPNRSTGVVFTPVSSDGNGGSRSNGLTGNIISGNAAGGVLIRGASTQYITLRNNRIGVAAVGTSPLGNVGGAGVTIDTGANNNYIGGFSSGEGNTIANNVERGVLVTSQAGGSNAILRNSVYGNTGLGIDLNTDGISQNDGNDGDGGANNTQNYPVITSASDNTITGTLNSLPNTNFRIELFSSPSADPTGYGEGQTFLTSQDVTTNATGNANFSYTGIGLGGLFVSATATRQTNIPLETSEFSKAVAVTSSACSLVVANTGDSGTGTLRSAINCANLSADASTITFASGVTGAINLNTALPPLGTPITITGPGAGNLTVRRGTAANTPEFRVFNVSNSTLSGPTVSLSGLTISGGRVQGDIIEANYGGGVFNDHGNLSVTNCTLSGNSAIFGGGIYSYGANGNATLKVANCLFSGNNAARYDDDSNGGDGGAIYNDGGSLDNVSSGGGATATITDSVFSNNTAANTGGALYAFGERNGDVVTNIARCTFTGNSAAAAAGVLYNDGYQGQAAVTVESSTMSGNSSPGATQPTSGGAFYNDGEGGGNATLSITGSTISNNNARFGGAIYNSGRGSFATVTVSNSTISGNSGSFYGAVVYNDGTNSLENRTTVTFSSVTLAGNFTTASSTAANAIYSYGLGSNITMSNSIFSAGATGANFVSERSGALSSQGYNIFSDKPTSLTVQSTDKTNTDAKLGPLASNGGPTQTHALLTGSLAINAGSTALTTDQRGIARPQGNSDDIGAFEVQTAVTPTATPTPKPTSTATPRPTTTPQPTATATPRPTATSTPRPTATSTPRPTITPGPTATPRPTMTATPRPTATATPRPTSTPKPTATPAPTSTPTPTATPLPALSINDVSVTEGNSGTKNAMFTVTLTGTQTRAVTVRYATSDGTASAGSDYTATSGTLTFGSIATSSRTPRAVSQTISVPIKGDTTREANETFFVILSNASGATLAVNRATGTIVNDDLVADLSVSQSVSASSVTTQSLATFTLIVRNNGPDATQNVTLSNILPSGSIFVSSTPTATSRVGDTLTFGLGTLAPGATRTLLITVRAPSSAGTLLNRSTVTGSGTVDPSPPNNGSSATVTVTTGAAAFSFSLGKLINVGPYSPSLYRPGGHFVQSVTIANTGTASSGTPLLLVLDGLPSSVTLVGASGTTGGAPYLTLFSSLGVGQSTTIRLEFRLTRSDKPLFTPRIIDGTQAF